MVAITEAFIDAIAPNAGAIKNGRDLARKNSFPKLCRSEDGTLLFGECQGSGKEPYRCSVDLVKPESPVYRCSCPSRQYPCKHILGLLYSHAQGKTFEAGSVPEDVAQKREQAEKREEKKKSTAATGEKAAPKKKVSQAALVKKMAAQLEGIDLLEKLLRQIVQTGFAAVDAPMLKLLNEQAKQLGNYYVPGLQAAFRELLNLLKPSEDRERRYTAVLDHITAIHAAIRMGRAYLEARKMTPDMPPHTETALEEWLGHAWQLSELKELGRVKHNVELAQLSFRSYTDSSREEFVDEGFWMDLSDGQIYTTRHYRPFRAAKLMKEEDTVFTVLQVKELFLYPGGMNPRIRFEELTMREMTEKDAETIRSFAKRSYSEVLKSVKTQIKHPLADKHPVVLLRYERLGCVKDQTVIEDEQGGRIDLGDTLLLDHPTTPLLPLLKEEQLEGQAMLVRFEHDHDQARLLAQPLSLVTPNETIRFVY